MKILNGVGEYKVTEPLFEAIRLALNYIGEDYSPEYFHGLVGTAFRIGGICPCAPTCTSAMNFKKLMEMFGYDTVEVKYKDGSDEEIKNMTDIVRSSIDSGKPAVVWHTYSMLEWDIVTGYDENEKVFFGRGSFPGARGDYVKGRWDRAKEKAGMVGMYALLIKEKSGELNRREAEIAALKEAVRHANDPENTDKINDSEWVFLNGKAAYNRWANDFSNPDRETGLGDKYCSVIYSSTHARAGGFLREIAANYPNANDLLLNAAELFVQEAESLHKADLLLSWDNHKADAERNSKLHSLLKEASGNYGKSIDIIESAVALM